MAWAGLALALLVLASVSAGGVRPLPARPVDAASNPALRVFAPFTQRAGAYGNYTPPTDDTVSGTVRVVDVAIAGGLTLGTGDVTIAAAGDVTISGPIAPGPSGAGTLTVRGRNVTIQAADPSTVLIRGAGDVVIVATGSGSTSRAAARTARDTPPNTVIVEASIEGQRGRDGRLDYKDDGNLAQGGAGAEGGAVTLRADGPGGIVRILHTATVRGGTGGDGGVGTSDGIAGCPGGSASAYRQSSGVRPVLSGGLGGRGGSAQSYGSGANGAAGAYPDAPHGGGGAFTLRGGRGGDASPDVLGAVGGRGGQVAVFQAGNGSAGADGCTGRPRRPGGNGGPVAVR